ncbi:MAG: transglycosylase SLT domain-containing protein [Lentisphaeria bacterium]|nr:transglycosylase SLT domain-containing protein [Lentisphaeria bacterium]
MANKYDVPPELLMALIDTESKFQPDAVGKAGEYGLMQIMPVVLQDWQRHNKRNLGSNSQLFDIDQNLEVGTWYLNRGLKRFEGFNQQEALALCYYNAGPSRAVKWAKQDGTHFIETIPFSSTKAYVKKILAKKTFYTEWIREYKESKEHEQR